MADRAHNYKPTDTDRTLEETRDRQISDDAGFEEPLDEGEEKLQDQVNHSRYSKLALRLDEDGWLPLVRAAYEDEKLTNNTFIKDCDRANWVYLADEVLSTVEPAILKAICCGDVNATCKGDVGLGRIVQAYADRSDKQATIYLRQMTVGPKEESLSLEAARLLALVALQYANQVGDTKLAADQAYAMDKKALGKDWHRSYTNSGRRHFIESSKGHVDTGKKRVLLGFSRALTRLADQAKKEKKTHIPFLQYVGYAIKGSQRKKQHDALTGTSWLFLFAKYTIESWKKGLKVNMHNFTVCLITEEVVCPVAEMLITRLARAYYFAGGFSIGQAGASMSSLRLMNFSQTEREKVWDENTRYVESKTNYTQTQAKELDSRRALQKAEYRAKILAKQDKIAKFTAEVSGMRDVLVKLRERMDPKLWEEEFPEEFAEFKDFEKYVEDATKMLNENA